MQLFELLYGAVLYACRELVSTEAGCILETCSFIMLVNTDA